MKQGALVADAEPAEFDNLNTADQEIPYQQNLEGKRISILILRVPTNRRADLKRLVSAALLSLRSIQPGQVFKFN